MDKLDKAIDRLKKQQRELEEQLNTVKARKYILQKQIEAASPDQHDALKQQLVTQDTQKFALSEQITVVAVKVISLQDRLIELQRHLALGKLTVKGWIGQQVNFYVKRASDRASCSFTAPKNARTFEALHKWGDFDNGVLETYNSLDDDEVLCNPLVWDALDSEYDIVNEVNQCNAPSDEQDVRGPLLAVLRPLSQVAGHLGYRVSYTGNGSARSPSFTDLIIKIRGKSSLEDLARLIMASIEIKGRWQWPLPEDLDLVEALEHPDHRERVIEVTQQVFGDAVKNECPYMMITTARVVYFLKRNFEDPAKTDLWVSPPVAVHNTTYPPLAAWLYMLQLADKRVHSDGSKLLDFPMFMVPQTPTEGYRLKLKGQDVLLNARFPQGHEVAGTRQQPARGRKHSGVGDAATLDAADLHDEAFRELVIASAAVDSSNSSNSSSTNSHRSSSSSSGPHVPHVAATVAADLLDGGFDGTGWAQRVKASMEGGVLGTACAVAAVEALPILPSREYYCSAECLAGKSGRAVFKGVVEGFGSAVVKVYNHRIESEVVQFVCEAVSFVDLGEEHGRSIIPLLGLGREDHTGNLMLILAEGQQLAGALSAELLASARDALVRVHAAGRLHGDVRQSNMLLYHNQVVLCDLERSFACREPSAFEAELQRWQQQCGSVQLVANVSA